MSTTSLSNTAFRLMDQYAQPLAFSTYLGIGFILSQLIHIEKHVTHTSTQRYVYGALAGMAPGVLGAMFAKDHKSPFLLGVAGVGFAGAFWSVRQIGVIHSDSKDQELHKTMRHAKIAMYSMVGVPCLVVGVEVVRYLINNRSVRV